MKIKKLPLLLCLVLMLTFVSVPAMAETEIHDIVEGDMILTADTCGTDCSGHVITGQGLDNNIQILSGNHKLTLSNLDNTMYLPALESDYDLKDVAGIYIADGVENTEITVDGVVNINALYAIYCEGASLTINGDDDSDLTLSSQGVGLYANNLTINGGKVFSGNSSEAAGLEERYGIICLGTFAAHNAEVFPESGSVEENGKSIGLVAKDFIAENSSLDITSNDVPNGSSIGIFATNSFKATDSYFSIVTGEAADSVAIHANNLFTVNGGEISVNTGKATNVNAGIYLADEAVADITEATVEMNCGEANYSYAICGSDAKMTIVDSAIDVTGGTATKDSIGIAVRDLTVTYSDITAIGGTAGESSIGIYGDILSVADSWIDADGGESDGGSSEGIFVTEITATDSNIIAEGGKAQQSYGIQARSIDITNGTIEGYGNEESTPSFGISLLSTMEENSVFNLTNANVIAKGAWLGVRSTRMDFPGISYKADENAATEVKSDLDGKEIYFGNRYSLVYDANGVDAEVPESASYYLGEEFELNTASITADGYIFLGWSDDPDALYPDYKVDESVTVGVGNQDITYYAIWQCLGGETCLFNDFTDLVSDEWYHDGIHFCLRAGYMYGTGETSFEPNTDATRAMVVTTLWRMDGEWEAENSSDFSDVSDETWYTDAVNWAAENGIVKGYEDGTFRPDQSATREELAAILYRYAEYCGIETAFTAIPATYTDKDNVSDWAADAMAWAVDAKIIYGVTGTTLAPQNASNRAQLATMLQRFTTNLIMGEE